MPEQLTMPVMDGDFEPCPLDTPCGNCQHPMRGHFGEKPKGYATACRECPCEFWNCQHGGVRRRPEEGGYG